MGIIIIDLGYSTTPSVAFIEQENYGEIIFEKYNGMNGTFLNYLIQKVIHFIDLIILIRFIRKII